MSKTKSLDKFLPRYYGYLAWRSACLRSPGYSNFVEVKSSFDERDILGSSIICFTVINCPTRIEEITSGDETCASVKLQPHHLSCRPYGCGPALAKVQRKEADYEVTDVGNLIVQPAPP